MYERSEVDGCSASTQVAAGSSRGRMQRGRSRVQGCKGQAAPESRGQAAAGARELAYMCLPLSASSSKGTEHHGDVSDSSGTSARWRSPAPGWPDLKGRERDTAAVSAALPRSDTHTRALSMARTEDARSIPADGQQPPDRTGSPAAGMAKAHGSPEASGVARALPSPCPRPVAAAVLVAGPCVHASYLSALPGGLLAAGVAEGLGWAGQGQARADVEPRRDGEGCLRAQESRTHARGGTMLALAHTRVRLPSAASRDEHQMRAWRRPLCALLASPPLAQGGASIVESDAHARRSGRAARCPV